MFYIKMSSEIKINKNWQNLIHVNHSHVYTYTVISLFGHSAPVTVLDSVVRGGDMMTGEEVFVVFYILKLDFMINS